MNAQQMVEHVTGFFMVSSGKLKMPLVTPEENLPRYKDFLLSNKEFRENTKAPTDVVPEEPLPIRSESMQKALEKLQSEIDAFVQYFHEHAGATTTHPVFGALNFDEWVLLHYKHVVHHLKQFGIGI